LSRLVSALFGLLLCAIAFIAAGRVADTREGLIAEVITLFAGLAGVALLLYGLVPKRTGATPAASPSRRPAKPSTRTANDLVIGVSGIALTVVLLGGLALSGGFMWALLGAALLIPMVAGSAYLVVGFARAPERDWSVDLARLFRRGSKS
jgi:hypothetical protein